MKEKRLQLLLALSLLSGGAILGIKKMVSNFVLINDFVSGFIDGIAISVSLFGLVYLAFCLIKHKQHT